MIFQNLFTACGGDGTAGVNYATTEDLPNCTPSREGGLAYVEEENASYACVEEEWKKVGFVYDSEDDFPNCTENGRGLYALDWSTGMAYMCDGMQWVSNGVVVKSAKNTMYEDVVGGSAYSNGILTDSRDGKKYRTTTIGNQTWMAQNLSYKAANVVCLSDYAEFNKYGCYYTWPVAMEVCPEGWHLPTTTEWNTLFTAVGGSRTAGKILKFTSDWGDYSKGTDAFGFSALPAGGFCPDYTEAPGVGAFFWSSIENGRNLAYGMPLDVKDDYASLHGSYDKNCAFSVRCIKDCL